MGAAALVSSGANLSGLLPENRRALLDRTAFAGERPRRTNQPYPENDVPHPHDFDAFGFVKTKPCCISVSW